MQIPAWEVDFQSTQMAGVRKPCQVQDLGLRTVRLRAKDVEFSGIRPKSMAFILNATSNGKEKLHG